MIFDWKKEFDEKTLCDGLDLKDDVKDLDVGYDLIYGWVDDHHITIGLADDFKVESMLSESFSFMTQKESVGTTQRSA